MIDDVDPAPRAADLGFTYRLRKNGDVEILHHGKLASTLRGTKARAFVAAIDGAPTAAAQQRMARLTGNFKRGNERTAGGHPRNRS
jgi:hypothetical protein